MEIPESLPGANVKVCIGQLAWEDSKAGAINLVKAPMSFVFTL